MLNLQLNGNVNSSMIFIHHKTLKHTWHKILWKYHESEWYPHDIMHIIYCIKYCISDWLLTKLSFRVGLSNQMSETLTNVDYHIEDGHLPF